MRRIAGVIGWPIAHSRSPALHEAAYRAAGIDAVYLAFGVREAELPAALEGVRALGLMGVNVTVPHKAAALRLCHAVDDVATATGAVNTIVVDDARRLVGTNTDVIGFARALDDAGVARGGRAIVLGAGGAARAVTVALRGRGVEVTCVARDLGRARALAACGAETALAWRDDTLAAAMPVTDLVVDATSAGLDDAGPLPAPVPVELLPAHATVCSLIYHREPALLAAARARGLATMDGGGMLVHQAAEAFRLMTGVEADRRAMFDALDGA